VARRVADAPGAGEAGASEAEVGALRAVGAITLLLDGVCRVHGIARAA
jgi:hypothetical protein